MELVTAVHDMSTFALLCALRLEKFVEDALPGQAPPWAALVHSESEAAWLKVNAALIRHTSSATGGALRSSTVARALAPSLVAWGCMLESLVRIATATYRPLSEH